jgi:hypothetical protein
MPVSGEGNERTAAPAPYPDLEALAEGLTAVLDGQSGESGLVQILDRKPNPYTSTFPGEVVTCMVADGSEHQLLCKYTVGGDHSDHGHRGGAGYEAEVYRQVLQGLTISLPAFHGAFACPQTGGICLVLEYLESGIRVSKLPVPGAMPAAAAWAGRFHALNEERVRQRDFSFLTRYDTDYYVGWSRRTVRYGGATASVLHPWLGTLCSRYEEMVPILTARPQTVIHGEYTPHNVLWLEGGIFPTDWESAAVAPGEIDLAILIEGWDEETVERCVQSYGQARGVPADAPFEDALGVARLYVAFRWLAALPDWPEDERSRWRLQQLKGLAERTGFLP